MICKIIFGELMKPIIIGEHAWIRKPSGIIRTTPVVDANRVSATELRFETRNTRYILNIVPMVAKEGGSI